MDLSIPSRDTGHMTLTNESSTEVQQDGLDRELDELQTRVELARRNPWHGGDIIAPEYARFLASLVDEPAGRGGHLVSSTRMSGGGRNVWREALEQVS